MNSKFIPPVAKLKGEQLKELISLADHPGFVVLVNILFPMRLSALKDASFALKPYGEDALLRHGNGQGQQAVMDYMKNIVERAEAELERRKKIDKDAR